MADTINQDELQNIQRLAKRAEFRNKPLKSLMKMFKVGLNKDHSASYDKVLRPLDKNGKIEPFPNNVEKFWKYWMSNCHDDIESFKNMVQLWQDMDMLYINSPIMSKAMNILSDETVQADVNMNCIGVEAEKKQKDFILNFFDEINIYSYIRPLALEIIKFGNAGVVLSLDKGIKEFIPINIYDFKSVLEFTPYQVQQKMEKRDKFFMDYSARDRIDHLLKSILNKENYASYFKDYVIGYQVGDYVLPPWRFIHFKNRTTGSPFKPFGTPLYLHSVAPYRQYDAAMTLQVVARGCRFPMNVYKINAPNIVDPVSKANYVTEFIREFQNSGINDTRKQNTGVGEEIFTIKDLFEFEQITPQIDLGKIDDIEMLKNDLVISSFVPKFLVDPTDNGFGEGGQSLAQKFKPFQRLVFSVQTIILDGLTQVCKIHMIESGEFATDEIDFQLTMPYPESQVDKDIIDNQKDLLDLSNAILDSISQRILGGQEVPEEIIKSVYYQIMPYDQKRIDTWFKAKQMAKKEGEQGSNSFATSFESIPKEDSEGDLAYRDDIKDFSNIHAASSKHSSSVYESYNTFKLVEKKLNENREEKINLTEEIKKSIFEITQKKIRNNSFNKKHIYSSHNKYEDFNALLLSEWVINEFENNDKDGKKQLKEEVGYEEEEKEVLEEEEKEVSYKHGRYIEKYKFSFESENDLKESIDS
jgi:hypothetical protein